MIPLPVIFYKSVVVLYSPMQCHKPSNKELIRLHTTKYSYVYCFSPAALEDDSRLPASRPPQHSATRLHLAPILL